MILISRYFGLPFYLSGTYFDCQKFHELPAGLLILVFYGIHLVRD